MTHILEVTQLKKAFKDILAVDDISFQVKQGEILGLLGPNGAGKSTTISMISTLLQPDSGDILYKGESVVSKPHLIKQQLGYVPQEISLFLHLTGYENLKFWGQVYGLFGDQLKQAIEEVSVMIGIKERLKDRVKTYSGGMKRRLNIGVALLHRPEFIIMDEPTVGIDPQSRAHILETVLRLNKDYGLTIIYTSHYMEEVEYLCDHVCIMDQGRIVASGTKKELIEGINDHEEITVRLEGNLAKAKEELLSIDEVSGVSIDNDQLVVTGEKECHLFKKIIDALSLNGYVILAANKVEPTLETVFLELTGKALRD